MKAYQERSSLRGLERTFSVARQQVSVWIQEHVQGLPPLRTTLLPAEPEDVLEFDEAWSFCIHQQKGEHKLWRLEQFLR